MHINWLNLYVLPTVCLVGVLIELISATTFYKINSTRQRRHKPIKIYEYLFLYSVSEVCILVINIVYGLLNCGVYCGIQNTAAAAYAHSEWFRKQFERFAKIYVCNTLYTFNVLVEFKIALDRYEKIIGLRHLNGLRPKKSKIWYQRSCFDSVGLVASTILALSMLINMPYIYIFKVDVDSYAQPILQPDLELISERPLWLKSIALVYFLKDFFCLVFICAFNCLLSMLLHTNCETRDRTNTNSSSFVEAALPEDESHVQSEMTKHFSYFYRRKEKRVAQMILILSAMFLVGHAPETFCRIERKLSIMFRRNDSNNLAYYLIISNIISFVASYFNLFIYLYFSKTFREQFKKSFLWFSTHRNHSV